MRPEQGAGDTCRGALLIREGTAGVPSPVKACCSSEARSQTTPSLAACCLRETGRPKGPNAAVGPVGANRWSDSPPIRRLPGPSGGLTAGQQQQRPACFSPPLRKPPPPTLTQSLPGPPGSLNPPLVSQPPTPTKYLRTLLWSTRTRDYFSTEHTGLGLFWLEHNTDLCQVLAASERGEAPFAQPRQALLTHPPRRGQALLCTPALCPVSAVRPQQSLPCDQESPRRPGRPCEARAHPPSPSVTNAPSRLVRRQAAGTAPPASGLCLSEQTPRNGGASLHKKPAGGPAGGPGPSLLLSPCSASGWPFCSWPQNGASSSQLRSHTPGNEAGEGSEQRRACQLPLALLIRRVISKQVPPGRFPLPAHQPELSHMDTPPSRGAEEVRCAAGYRTRALIKNREGVQQAAKHSASKGRGKKAPFWVPILCLSDRVTLGTWASCKVGVIMSTSQGNC